MVLISSHIEIARSPEEVRDAFLDFSHIPEYSHFFASIEPPPGKTKDQIEKGDKLNVAIGTTKFSPPVLENTASEFKWVGAIPYLFIGEHSFRFEPSKTKPGATTFVNEEDFTGLLSFMMWDWYGYGSGLKCKQNFEGFNEDLKKHVEGGSAKS